MWWKAGSIAGSGGSRHLLPRKAGEGDHPKGGGGGEPHPGSQPIRAKTLTFKRARSLRRQLTPPEARLWLRLRIRGDGRPVFRRQHPVGAYIVDFYCADARLAVEVDGALHDEPERMAHDRRRDAWLADQGVMVMRIPAREVMSAADEVAESVVRLALRRVADRA